MNKQKITIWDRNFDLDVKYDCYTDENVLDSQKAAVVALVESEKCIEESLDYVKNYCISLNQEEIGTNSIENIFKYVMPKYLFVSREDKNHVIAIMCNYKFDQENGIAIVFKNEKFFKIGKQDIVL